MALLQIKLSSTEPESLLEGPSCNCLASESMGPGTRTVLPEQRTLQRSEYSTDRNGRRQENPTARCGAVLRLIAKRMRNIIGLT